MQPWVGGHCAMRIKLEMKPLAAPPLFEKQRINKEPAAGQNKSGEPEREALTKRIAIRFRSPELKLCLHACAARKLILQGCPLVNKLKVLYCV
jgi:hypothetical protein